MGDGIWGLWAGKKSGGEDVSPRPRMLDKMEYSKLAADEPKSVSGGPIPCCTACCCCCCCCCFCCVACPGGVGGSPTKYFACFRLPSTHWSPMFFLMQRAHGRPSSQVRWAFWQCRQARAVFRRFLGAGGGGGLSCLAGPRSMG